MPPEIHEAFCVCGAAGCTAWQLRSLHMGTAAEIVTAILLDLSDRRGLRHAWDGIDVDIKREIVRTWTQLAATEIAKG